MTVTEKRRPRRIAADEAHAWARNLRLGNVHAKLVLSMLSLYVNGEGEAFVGIDQLAEDCEVAANTVRSRLVWLEKIGAIVRIPHWIDEHGNRNRQGRGKRSTDLIRLMINADPDGIEARAKGDFESDADEEFSPPPHGGLNRAVESVSPPVALQQPSNCVEGLISEPEPEDSPPSPPPGGSVDEPEGWKEFETDWVEPIGRQSLARPIWQALTPSERQLARQAARGYVAWRKAQRKPPNVLGAHLFLRERAAWERYAAYAPGEAARTSGGRTLLAPGSDEARAVLTLHAIARASPPFRIGDGRLSFKGEVTPQILALAQAPPRETWPCVTERQQIAAWAGFVAMHVTGARPPFTETTDGRSGVHAPWPWPPNKDGKVHSAAPPGPVMTDDDAQAFAREGSRG